MLLASLLQPEVRVKKQNPAEAGSVICRARIRLEMTLESRLVESEQVPLARVRWTSLLSRIIGGVYVSDTIRPRDI